MMSCLSLLLCLILGTCNVNDSDFSTIGLECFFFPISASVTPLSMLDLDDVYDVGSILSIYSFVVEWEDFLFFGGCPALLLVSIILRQRGRFDFCP